MDAGKVLVGPEEVIAVQVPHDVAFRAQHLPDIGFGDEALRRFVEIARVVERQAGTVLFDCFQRVY